MIQSLKLTAWLALAIMSMTVAASAQKAKVHQGKVCGDPTITCNGQENFKDSDLVFDVGKNFAFFESEYFYGIVLKSAKLPDWGDCDHPSFGEDERTEIQAMFPKNKVFTLNCVDTGTNYYEGVADKSAFVGVYAGRTLAAANVFLKTVQATKKFPGIRVRRMKVGINGT